MCYEAEYNGELLCPCCGSAVVFLVEEHEELGILYSEYNCKECGEDFMDEEEDTY